MKAVEDPGWFGNVFVGGRLSLLLGDSRDALGSAFDRVLNVGVYSKKRTWESANTLALWLS